MLKDENTASVFSSLSSISVGRGNKVLFWTDRWVEGWTVEQIVPLIFKMVSTRRKNSKTVEEAMQENRWVLDVGGNSARMRCSSVYVSGSG